MCIKRYGITEKIIKQPLPKSFEKMLKESDIYKSVPKFKRFINTLIIYKLRIRDVVRNLWWKLRPKSRREKIFYYLFRASDHLNKLDDGRNYFLAKVYIGDAVHEMINIRNK